MEWFRKLFGGKPPVTNIDLFKTIVQQNSNLGFAPSLEEFYMQASGFGLPVQPQDTDSDDREYEAVKLVLENLNKRLSNTNLKIATQDALQFLSRATSNYVENWELGDKEFVLPLLQELVKTPSKDAFDALEDALTDINTDASMELLAKIKRYLVTGINKLFDIDFDLFQRAFMQIRDAQQKAISQPYVKTITFSEAHKALLPIIEGIDKSKEFRGMVANLVATYKGKAKSKKNIPEILESLSFINSKSGVDQKFSNDDKVQSMRKFMRRQLQAILIEFLENHKSKIPNSTLEIYEALAGEDYRSLLENLEAILKKNQETEQGSDFFETVKKHLAAVAWLYESSAVEEPPTDVYDFVLKTPALQNSKSKEEKGNKPLKASIILNV